MKLHHLKPAPGAHRKRTRKGRGEAAGKGKTAGRGTKGTGARGTMRVGFEGGQTPLQQRLPKLPGFTPRNRVEFATVNVGQLDGAFDADAEVTPDALRAKGAVFSSGARPRSRLMAGRQSMKASLFAQMGYSDRHKFPATWPVPPSYHDPAVTMQSYEDGLEECELAEEMGFDWISCSEHHYSGNRLTPNPAVMAAASFRRRPSVSNRMTCQPSACATSASSRSGCSPGPPAGSN